MVTFEQAKDIPELRQAYIDSIDLGDRRRYVSEIRYIDRHAVVNGLHAFMVCSGSTKKKKAKISIPLNAFYPAVTEGDFLSTLKDHELIHAEQFYTGRYSTPLKTDLEEKLIDIVTNLTYYLRIELEEKIRMEVEAYRNQINAMETGLRNVSERKKSHVRSSLAIYEMSHGPLKIISQLLQEGPDEYHQKRVRQLFGKENLTELLLTLEGITPEEQELIKTFIK